MAELTAISDKETRRLFQQQAQAFALYRQRLAGNTSAVGQEAGAASSGTVSAAGQPVPQEAAKQPQDHLRLRSEEHTSELQSLMRISYAVFCLTKKKIKHTQN